MRFLVAACILILSASASIAAALEGTWNARILNENVVELSISYGRNNHTGFHANDGKRLQISDLPGLSPAAVASSSQTPVAFELQREAGRVRFEGTFRDGKGSGHFEFFPDAGYASRLEAAGARIGGSAIEPHKQLLMLMLDITSSRIREMGELGYTGMSLEQVVSSGIFRVTPQMVREFRDAGYRDLSLEMLTKLRIHRVTVSYIRELEKLGLGEISLDRAAEMSVHRVTPEYVRELRDLGYASLSPRQLIEMRIHRVTPELIRELAAAGYRDVPVAQLIRIRIHGVEDILIHKKK
jgi:hypothetical protein